MSRANEPAMPEHNTYTSRDGDVRTDVRGGLTIREHFAGQFLAALLTQPVRTTDGLHECEIAVAFADALLAELAKVQP